MVACYESRKWSEINGGLVDYIIVRPKVDQRAGQLSLLHIGITNTEKNTTKT